MTGDMPRPDETGPQVLPASEDHRPDPAVQDGMDLNRTDAPSTGWARLRRRGGEAGSGGGISLMMLIAAIALLMVVGLVLDGSTKAHALDRANQLASEAARAGLQAVNPDAHSVDAVAVNAAVGGYLQRHGITTYSSEVAGPQLTVQVSITAPTKMLSAIGIDTFTVTGTAAANLVYD